jgi:hypothetical protein
MLRATGQSPNDFDQDRGCGLHDDLSDHTRTKVKVTLKSTRGPFKGFDVPSDHKLIGVVLRFANAGELRYEDPRPDGVLKLAGGDTGKLTTLIPLGRRNPCDSPSVKLKAGQSKSVCIAFEVPKRSELKMFEYVTDSGFGDTGQWALGPA